MHVVNLAKDDVSGTTRYVLVDKSNSTVYPHRSAEDISLERLEVQVDKEGTGDWVLRVGFVEETDASNGSVTFFYTRRIRGISSILETVSYISSRGQGLSMAQAIMQAIGSDDVDDSTNWQNDVDLADATGTDIAPVAGDIVIELEEVTGTATVSFSISAHYSLVTER